MKLAEATLVFVGSMIALNVSAQTTNPIKRNTVHIKQLEATVKPLPGLIHNTQVGIDALQQQITETQEALSTIELTPGPAGPQGEPGEDGADGPLAELVCESGEFAMFNGVNWVCSVAPNTSVEPVEALDEGCFKGFLFTVNEPSGTADWLQSCVINTNEVEYAKQWEFTPGDTASLNVDYLAPPEIELFNSDFDYRIMAISFSEIDLANIDFSVDIHITSLNPGLDTAVQDWATNVSGKTPAKTLEIVQHNAGFEAVFTNCLPLSHLAKPAYSSRLFEEDDLVMVEQSITIRCSGLDDFSAPDAPFVNSAVQSIGSGNWLTVSLEFDQSAGPAMAGFNESYLGLPSRLQLPAFNYSATSLIAETHLFTATALKISVLKETGGTDAF